MSDKADRVIDFAKIDDKIPLEDYMTEWATETLSKFARAEDELGRAMATMKLLARLDNCRDRIETLEAALRRIHLYDLEQRDPLAASALRQWAGEALASEEGT